MSTLAVAPLTREAFAPFGDVIDCEGGEHFSINEASSERFHDLANVDVTGNGGRVLISIFRSQPRQFPFEISMVERHPLGSQAFMPLGDARYIVVVAGGGDAPGMDDLRAFLAAPDQGINFARNVWHHPLIAFGGRSDFLVIDRGGPGENLEEYNLAGGPLVIAEPALTVEE